MNTKETIIATTKRLCNENKASNITTNHIALEMGISAGNLYYHFRNKEEIIREIYYELFEQMDKIWYDPSFAVSEEGIVHFFYRLNALLYEYRFCYIELNLLVTRDPELKEKYVERSLKIIDHLADTFLSWIEAGIMKTFRSDEERYILAKNSWLVGQLWISYSDILYDAITSRIVAEGVVHSYSILKPYLKSESDRKMNKLIEALKLQINAMDEA